LRFNPGQRVQRPHAVNRISWINEWCLYLSELQAADIKKPVLSGMIDDNFKIIVNWVPKEIPARIDVELAAKLLGFSADDLTILMGAGHLMPLGKPAPNAPKYFSALEIMGLAANRSWLDKATRIVSQYWLKKRQRRKIADTSAITVADAP
jgi:hypothetical protein